MSEVRIYLHAEGPPDFTSTDRLVVDLIVGGVRQTFVHDLLVAPYLIGAHDLAPIVRYAGARLWASTLEAEEEAHMVRVEVTP